MILAAVNVAVFFFLSFQGMTEDAGFMLEHGAMYVPLMLEQGKYSPMFTSMFLHFGFSHLVNNMVHFGFSHLVNNMVMLLVIGWNLELEIGRIKFVIIYFASGLCGNVASALWDFRTGDYAVSAGASGAIFGITGALLYVAIRNRGQIGNVTGRGLMLMVALSLYYGFSSGGVDNFAHIGGLASGFVLAVLLYWKRNREYRTDSWGGGYY